MPAPRPRARRARAAAVEKVPWGWLEWFVILQTFIPALLFIPGLSAVRTATRIGAYTLGLVAWGGVALGAKKAPVTGRFPAKPWLLGCMAWLVLILLHPNSYAPMAALGHAVLYVAILSPAFWAGEAVRAPKQVGRVMAVLFLCNAASATVGLGQVFYPDRLNPPVIPIMELRPDEAEALKYETADGRKVLRPCGLTDTPGAGGPAGAATALIGLCFALRPLPWWRRGACVALAFVGVAVIYYTQVRAAMVTLAIGFVALTGVLFYQGEVRRALALAGGGAAVIVGALFWVARTMGSRVFERFGTLVGGAPGAVFQRNRGGFVAHAFQSLSEDPLGLGLGWWGMVHLAFRDPHRISPVWVEVMFQAWAVDGGIPLMVLYLGAVAAALYDSARIALTARDRDLAFWGAVVLVQNLSTAVLCLSYPVFLAPAGLQFWLLASALHAADAQSRAASGSGRPRRRFRLRPQPKPRPGLPGPAAP
jgi:hypothetical protein